MPERSFLLTPTDLSGKILNAGIAATAPGPYVEYAWALRLEAYSTITSATLVLNALILDIDGEITPTTQTMTITGTGLQTGVEARVGRGWLIGLSVRATAGTIEDGEITASVHVVRNAGNTLEYLMTLASGTVTRARALGLNAYTGTGGGTVTDSSTLAVTTVASPAAGADWTATVPVGETWTLQTIRASLQASAAAANREISLSYTDGTNILLRVTADAFHTANQLRSYNATNFGFQYVPPASLGQMLPVPPLVLGPGYTVGVVTASIQAADQWSLISISYLLS